jgi:hypothetical protein
MMRKKSLETLEDNEHSILGAVRQLLAVFLLVSASAFAQLAPQAPQAAYEGQM